MIQSRTLANEASYLYETGKEFLYDHVTRDVIVPFKKGSDTRINIKVNAQRRSMKGLLLLFVEPYTAGTRDSEKYIFPDIKKKSALLLTARRICFTTTALKVGTFGARPPASS